MFTIGRKKEIFSKYYDFSIYTSSKKGGIGLKHLKSSLFFALTTLFFLTPSVFACELTVNERGVWVDAQGMEASEEDIVLCMEQVEKETLFEEGSEEIELNTSDLFSSMSTNGKVMMVVVLLFMLSFPLFFLALLIFLIFAVQKKPLKGPGIFLAITIIIPLLLYLFSIA